MKPTNENNRGDNKSSFILFSGWAASVILLVVFAIYIAKGREFFDSTREADLPSRDDVMAFYKNIVGEKDVDYLIKMLKRFPQLANNTHGMYRGSGLSIDATSPVNVAASYHFSDAIQHLVMAGSNIEIRDPKQSMRTPVHALAVLAMFLDLPASGENDKQLLRKTLNAMRFLLEHGANPNTRGKNGQTPLFDARQPDAFELLLKHGADINARDDNGQTVMHHILDSPHLKHSKYIAMILKYHPRADLDAVDLQGKSVMQYIRESHEFDIINEEILKPAGIDALKP